MNPMGPNPPHGPPFHAPRKLPHTSLAIAAFAVALVGFLAGLFPFAGFVGTIGLVLGIVDLRKNDGNQGKGYAFAAIGFGTVATLGAFVWVWIFTSLANSSHGSCPHLYAFDGQRFVLDADLASGALYKGGERDDSDRLEALREVDGRYRVRLQNDLEEVDVVDSLALLVVDAPKALEVLPTPSGELVALDQVTRPTRATDSRGGDVLAAIAHEDGRTIGATRPVEAPDALVDGWTLEFPRPVVPPNGRAMLVVRGRNTAFAEDAFVKYMAEMGQGVRPLLEYASSSKEGCACYHHYLDAEIDRLGFPLGITLASAGAPEKKRSLSPVGPAVLRSQAVPVDLPAGEGPVTVRLEATPRFWEIDQVELAVVAEQSPELSILAPRSATAITKGDGALDSPESRTLLRETDDQRLVLRPGEHVEVVFDAPPPPADGRSRTVVARLRGYYELDIGGPRGVNVSKILAHRLGLTSLPRFARRLD